LVAVIAVACAGAPAQATFTGTIKGRVLNQTTGTPQEGVTVTLATVDRSGETSRARTVSDAHGRFVFRGVAAGAKHVYAVNGAYAGGLFAGGAIRIPSQTTAPPVIRSKLNVWNTTSDPATILIRRDDMFVDAIESGVGVIENVTVINPTKLAYIGRGAQMSSRHKSPPQTLGFALPSSVDPRSVGIVRSDIYLPELVPTDYGFAATVAIPPGTTQILFSYQAHGAGGSFDLSHTALYTVAEMSVLADISAQADAPIAVKSDRFERAGTVPIGTKRYARWTSTSRFEPGDTIPIEAVAQARLSSWLLVGAVAGLTLIGSLGAWAWTRRRPRRAPKAPDEQRPEPETKDDLLIAIAELDLAYQAGEMTKKTWTDRRSALTTRIADGASAPTASERAP
jgi:hypothetical protein